MDPMIDDLSYYQSDLSYYQFDLIDWWFKFLPIPCIILLAHHPAKLHIWISVSSSPYPRMVIFWYRKSNIMQFPPLQIHDPQPQPCSQHHLLLPWLIFNFQFSAFIFPNGRSKSSPPSSSIFFTFHSLNSVDNIPSKFIRIIEGFSYWSFRNPPLVTSL